MEYEYEYFDDKKLILNCGTYWWFACIKFEDYWYWVWVDVLRDWCTCGGLIDVFEDDVSFFAQTWMKTFDQCDVCVLFSNVVFWKIDCELCVVF